jgi:hypothetical protein
MVSGSAVVAEGDRNKDDLLFVIMGVTTQPCGARLQANSAGKQNELPGRIHKNQRLHGGQC